MSGLATRAAYVRPRAGLGELPDRLRREPCRIAYLGGSITAQRKGYRPTLHARLQAVSGQDHASVTAGISGSGSISGVFVMDDLVVAHRPDLCFVEFTSRDSGAAVPWWVGPAVEGIVVKLRECGCQPCFLHLYRGDAGPGVYDAVVQTYERVADHYGVPSIDVASRFRELVSNGEVSLTEVLRDYAHTTPSGAELVADLIFRALLEIQPAAAPKRPVGRLYGQGFRETSVVPAPSVAVREPGRAERGRFRFFYDYVSIGAGNAFECSFEDELVGMLVVLGPSSGGARITTDDDVHEVMLWDEECYYERLSTVVFDRRHRPGERVTIGPTEAPAERTLVQEPIEGDHDAGPRLKVVGFLVRG